MVTLIRYYSKNSGFTDYIYFDYSIGRWNAVCALSLIHKEVPYQWMRYLYKIYNTIHTFDFAEKQMEH